MKFDKGYCLGKGASALEDLQSIFEDLKREDLNIEELRQAIFSSAYCALYDFTKVLSCVSETEWSSDDRDKITKDGKFGVEDLLVRYGWLSKEQTARFRVESAAKRIFHLAKGTRAQSRTLLHEALNQIPEGTESFDELRDILEAVTMGERSWEDVQTWCETHAALANKYEA